MFEFSGRTGLSIPEFDGIADVMPTPELLERLELDRMPQRYASLINLAKMIPAQISPERAKAADAEWSPMFD